MLAKSVVGQRWYLKELILFLFSVSSCCKQRISFVCVIKHLFLVAWLLESLMS